METISQKIVRIIADTLGVEKNFLTPNTHFRLELAADSLDIIELISILEGEFKVAIPDEFAERLQTVGDVVNYFEKTKTFPVLSGV